MSVIENDPVAEAIAWLRSIGRRDTCQWASVIEALRLGAEMRFKQVGRLVKENGQLRAALEPIAAAAEPFIEVWTEEDDGFPLTIEHAEGGGGAPLTIGDLRRAHAACRHNSLTEG